MNLDADLDVLVVGAGISGIGAAYRLRTELPTTRFAVFEARDTYGGTWDLFRYPGVRSDSDMYTFAYPFRPWEGSTTLTSGADIRSYLGETVAEAGIGDAIHYGRRVVGAEFDSATALWTVTFTMRGPGGEAVRHETTCRFLYACTGYYDYARPHDPVIPGIADFAGRVLHPQFWPADPQLAGKQVVVVGSGATAVTLVPALADQGVDVTMLQRTPSWIGVVPRRDRVAMRLQRHLPAGVADRINRARYVVRGSAVYRVSRRFPALMRRLLLSRATAATGDARLVAENLTPPYNPWEQRLCATADGDFFTSLANGSARIRTGHIDRIVPDGLRLTSGEVLPADVIVTATGLRLLPLGDIALRVDGTEVDLSDELAWRGTMLTHVPNFAFCIGYINASWTLRADLTSRIVCRILGIMRRGGYAVVEPTESGATGPVTRRPLLDLASNYIRRSIDRFPKQGDRDPWLLPQSYLTDLVATRRAFRRTGLPEGLRGKRISSGAGAGGNGVGHIGDEGARVAAGVGAGAPVVDSASVDAT